MSSVSNSIKPGVDCDGVVSLVCEPGEPRDVALFIAAGRLENRGGNFRTGGPVLGMYRPGGLVVLPWAPVLICRC